MSTFRADRAIDALTPAFVQWFDDGSAGAATAALECLMEVKGVIDRYMEGTAAAEVTVIDKPDLAEDEALEVFAGLPLIQRTTALLRWIGDGRPVAGTGALRLKDLEAAAACVGVSVRGAGTGARPDNAIPTVRSMQAEPGAGPILCRPSHSRYSWYSSCSS